jgi:general secretion pathway protein J
MKACVPIHPRQLGFTLIEVVLALTIFALMGSILYGVFSLSHNAVEKSQASFERSQRLRSVSDLLGSYIRSSYPYHTSPQDQTIFYEGEEDRVSFVSSLSLALGGRGIAKIHISWDEEENSEGNLKLEEEIPVQNGDGAGEGLHNRVTLEQRIKEFHLAYLDPQSEDETWEERWDGRERRMLPRAVRVSYRMHDGKEVRWVFPIMMSVLAP